MSPAGRPDPARGRTTLPHIPAMLRLLPCLLALALAALVAPAAASAAKQPAAKKPTAVTVGIADQKADVFNDPRFERLGIRQARLFVGWDAMRSDWQKREIDQWLFLARLQGVNPLVTFGHSRTRRRSLPSPKRMRSEFRTFRRRYPWVRTFATWNEANHCGEPVCNKPKLVAQYWRQLRISCPRCTIVAVELLDQPNIVSWARRFRRAAGREPGIWGLHNYVEANRFRMTRTQSFLKATRGKVWITETGGLVRRRNRSTTDIPESPSHAARVTRYLFDHVARKNPRITRLYLYQWNVISRRETWDSAFIGPDGKRRPAYDVLVDELDDLPARRRR